MALPLPSHVHLAVLGEDAVFLDIAADAYTCVAGGAAFLRPTPDRRAVDPADPAVAEALREAGLLGAPSPDAAACGGAGAARPGLPVRDLPPGPPEGPSLREALRLLLAYGDYLVRYRGRPFAEVLAHAAAASSGGVDPAEVFRLARLFARAAVWLPLPGKCLARSFVLLRFLQRSGQGAAWVFGVRTWPFAAHCWLQAGDVVLDDFADRLAPFEPILALG